MKFLIFSVFLLLISFSCTTPSKTPEDLLQLSPKKSPNCKEVVRSFIKVAKENEYELDVQQVTDHSFYLLFFKNGDPNFTMVYGTWDSQDPLVERDGMKHVETCTDEDHQRVYFFMYEGKRI